MKKKLKTPKYPTNFKYPKIKDTDRTYGADFGPVLRENGDWRDYLPPDEDQRVNGLEASDCYIQAQQRGISVIQEERFNLPDQNHSSRFNALLSDGGESGGDPIKGAKSIKYDGLIPDRMMNFEGVKNWKEYHSWKGVNEADCRTEGKKWLTQWEPKFKIVAEREDLVETKYAELREALKRSPVQVSVCAWHERNGMYYKPQGRRDTHLTLAVNLDEQNRIHTRDTYPPYHKILEPNTNFEFAMRWTVEKQATTEEINIILQILKKLGEWAGIIAKNQEKPVDTPLSVPKPTLREKIHAEALKWRGKDASPTNQAPQELACAESVCHILRNVGVDIPLLISTTKLNTWLSKSPLFKLTTDAKEGNIIISPTGKGNGNIPNGHTGIFAKDGRIMSNDSNVGMWLENYTIDGWVKRYRKQGGFPINYYEAI